MRCRAALFACAAALLAACAGEPVEPEAVAAGSADGKSPLAIAADQLLEADRAFAARMLEKGAPEAFHDWFDAQGVRLTFEGEPPVGPQPVGESVEKSASVFSWDPRYAEVFAPGDWGLTWGDWQACERGAGGRQLAAGRYLNIWKKQRDGSWKVHMNLLPAP